MELGVGVVIYIFGKHWLFLFWVLFDGCDVICLLRCVSVLNIVDVFSKRR